MSNVRIILEDGSPAEQIVALALWHAKKARLDGMKHGFHRVTKLGDYTARIRLDDFGGDRVYLSYREDCPPLLYKGFVDTWGASLGEYSPEQVAAEYRNHMLPLGDTDYGNVQAIPESGIPDGYYQVPPLMYGVRPADGVHSLTEETDTSPPTPSTEHPLQLVSDPGDEWRRFFREHLPSRYSGIMRKVLQVTFATAQWKDALTYMPSTGETKFLLNYQFGDTWGVVLTPGTNGSDKSHYNLIWISTGEVQYVPADFCVGVSMVGTAREYVPKLLKVYRTRGVRIGTVPSFGGSACSANVGWAFSYEDPKASVVIYGSEGYDEVRNEDGIWYNTKLVTVEVQFLDSRPASCTWTVGTSHMFWNHLRSDKNTKVTTPFGIFNIPNGDKIETMNVRNFPAPVPSGYYANNIPVHVYYSPGVLNPTVIRYLYRTSESHVETLPAPTSAEEAFSRHEGTKSEGGYVEWGFSSDTFSAPTANGSYEDSYTEYVLGEPCLPYAWDFGGYTRKFNVKFHNEDFVTTGYFPRYATEMRPNSIEPCVVGTGGYPYPEDGPIADYKSYTIRAHVSKHEFYPTGTYNIVQLLRSMWVNKKVVERSGGNVTVYSNCTLSPFDRECALLFSEETEAPKTHTETRSELVVKYYEPGAPFRKYSGAIFGGTATYGNDPQSHLQYGDPTPDTPGVLFATTTLQISAYARGSCPACLSTPSCVEFVGEYGSPNAGQFSWPFSDHYWGPRLTPETYMVSGYPCREGAYIAEEVIHGYGNTYPTATLSHNGKVRRRAVLVSSSGDVPLNAESWEYALKQVYDIWDNFTFHVTGSAFGSNLAYDKTPMRMVVHIGNKEYDVRHMCNGWIGVV